MALKFGLLVPQGWTIDNLPDGCVEVACLVDRNGVLPCHFGELPEQLAALNRSHMAIHTLMCEALLTERDLVSPVGHNLTPFFLDDFLQHNPFNSQQERSVKDIPSLIPCLASA